MTETIINPEADGLETIQTIHGPRWAVWTDNRGDRHEGPAFMQSGDLCSRDEHNGVIHLVWASGKNGSDVMPDTIRVFRRGAFRTVVFTNGQRLTLRKSGRDEDGLITGVTVDDRHVRIPETAVCYMLDGDTETPTEQICVAGFLMRRPRA